MRLQDKVLAKIYESRGVKDAKELRPKRADLSDWDELEYAAKMTYRGLYQGNEFKNIGVVYDPDVDGLYAGMEVEDYLSRTLYTDYSLFRYMSPKKEHGITEEVVSWVLDNKINWLFVVDAGTGNVGTIKKLYKKGVTIVILDHHEYSRTVKNTERLAVVNPYKYKNKYPKTSGAGVVFYFLERLSEYTGAIVDMYEPLVGITILSDVCSMRDADNRYFVQKAYGGREGSELFRRLPFYGSYHSFYVYKVVPYLNGLIRSGEVEWAMTLVNNASLPRVFNKVVRDVERVKSNQEKAKAALINELKFMRIGDFEVGIYSSEEYRNYTGVTASKLVDEDKKNVLVIRKFGETYKGSFRGYDGTKNDLKRAGMYAEGHLQACGVEIPKGKLKEMVKKLKVLPEERVDVLGESDYEISGVGKGFPRELWMKLATMNEFVGSEFPEIKINLTKGVKAIRDVEVVSDKLTVLTLEGGMRVLDFEYDEDEKDGDILVTPKVSNVGYSDGYALLRVK